MNIPPPTEEQDQIQLVKWLSLRPGNLDFFHVPNGGKRNPREAHKLKLMGVKRGVPDLFILNPPPKIASRVGTVIELKRLSGGRLSNEQARWLKILEMKGWHCLVPEGLHDAIRQIESLGY